MLKYNIIKCFLNLILYAPWPFSPTALHGAKQMKAYTLIFVTNTFRFEVKDNKKTYFKTKRQTLLTEKNRSSSSSIGETIKKKKTARRMPSSFYLEDHHGRSRSKSHAQKGEILHFQERILPQTRLAQLQAWDVCGKHEKWASKATLLFVQVYQMQVFFIPRFYTTNKFI
jgi:hypothetical protein